MFHVPNKKRVRTGRLASDDSAGNNGAFRLRLGTVADYTIRVINCIASDGMGWEHVSVSVAGKDRCPNWSEMCKVKAVFWDDEDCVVQFHPPKSEYVNVHPFVLHLWRPTAPEAQIATPPNIMV